MEAGDSQKFADSLAEFDSMTRLDAWKTSLLLKVRRPAPLISSTLSVRYLLGLRSFAEMQGLRGRVHFHKASRHLRCVSARAQGDKHTLPHSVSALIASNLSHAKAVTVSASGLLGRGSERCVMTTTIFRHVMWLYP